MEGRKCVGVTRLIFWQPSSISRSTAARSPAGESGFPKFSCEITPFWQNAQRSVHPEKKTAPLP